MVSLNYDANLSVLQFRRMILVTATSLINTEVLEILRDWKCPWRF
jgi:hypothetical protein